MWISGAAIAASLLSAPVAWTGYVVLLMPVFVSRPWSWPMAVAAAALTLPNGIVMQLSEQSFLLHLLFSSWYAIPMILVIVASVGDFGPLALANMPANRNAEGQNTGRTAGGLA